MPVRRTLPYVAVIAAAILTIPTGPARAATKTCDVMPERCRWGSDGLLYYYLPGQRLPTGIPGPSGVDPTARNSASWGCAASGGEGNRGRGWTWGARDRATAAQIALGACAARNRTSCHIISCRASIRTREEAHATWPVPSRAGQ